MRLDQKTIIVTGGASGLGRAYCRHFTQEGANVVIADIAFEQAALFAEELNTLAQAQNAAPVYVDATSEADTNSMAQFAFESFGRIDVLVNNVGTYPHAAFDNISYAQWCKVIHTNLDSVFLCSRAVLPYMRDQKAGKIINVATNLVWIGLPGMAHYIAAKAGVVGLTRALARELGELNISVNAIAPGAVIPPIHELDDRALERVEQIVNAQSLKWCQSSSDLIGAMLFLASSDSDFITGQILTVDGGLTNH